MEPKSRDRETPEQMSFDYLFDGSANGLPVGVTPVVPKQIQMKTAYGLSVFTPLDYLCSYRYPLLVWLHSQDSTEQELLKIIPKISLRNYVCAAPAGFSVNKTIAWPIHQLHEIELRVLETINQVRGSMNIHSRRIFIAGIQSGGTAAMALALSRPDLFAGAASFNGPVPRFHVMFRQFKLQKKQSYFVGIPANPEGYPAALLKEDIDMFNNAGINIQFKDYSAETDTNRVMYSDLNRWIMRSISTSIF